MRFTVNTQPYTEKEFFKIFKDKVKHSTSSKEECFDDLIQTHCCSFISNNILYTFEILK